ncbi:MAG: hypothetical protein H6727_11590 [Myxococcales bacterium]|nr:hypothetical protein [Myxococcales bacterium]
MRIKRERYLWGAGICACIWSVLLMAAGPSTQKSQRGSATSQKVVQEGATSRPSSMSASLPTSMSTSQPLQAPIHGLPSEIPVPPSQVEGASTFAITYTGGIKGYIEPCGCQAGMLGGVARLSGLMHALKARGVGSFSVDAGSLFFEGLEIEKAKLLQAQLKADLLADTMRQIGAQVMGVGPYDLALGRKVFDTLWKRAGMQAIASNLVSDKDGRPLYPQRWFLEQDGHKIGFLALTGKPVAKPDQAVVWPKGYWKRQGLRLLDPQKSAKEQVALLRKEGAKMIVLLSTLGRSQTEVLLERVEGIDLAFDGEEGEGIEAPRLLHGGRSLLMITEKDGQKAGVIALYKAFSRTGSWVSLQTPAGRIQEIKALEKQAKGYLRQAEQMKQQGEDFAPIAAVYTKQAVSTKEQIAALKKQLSAPPTLPKQGRPYLHQLYALSSQIPDLPRSLQQVKVYEAAVKKANLEAMAHVKPIPFTKDGDFFVGAETCRACHASAYNFWKTTRHAGAYTTLEKKQKQFDMDCIGCHVVGWQKPGGLFDLQKPGRFAHVQCENCHSYGGLHARTANSQKNGIKRKVTASVCAQCHRGHHHPDFQYNNNLHKILGKGHGEALWKKLLEKQKK